MVGPLPLSVAVFMVKRKLQKKIRNFFRPAVNNREISPDEIFLDSSNVSSLDVHQFEGRLEKPIAPRSAGLLLGFFVLVVGLFCGKLWMLEIRDGVAYAQRSENNRLEHTIVFAERGVIYDRNGVELAWNAPNTDAAEEFPLRIYRSEPGLAHVLGYGSYPSKDRAGFYYRTDFIGESGVEKIFDEKMRGRNGLRMVEVDALRRVQSQSSMHPSQDGDNLTLALDARLQSKLYASLKEVADQGGFEGGAGVIMDVATGELLALTSYPEYDPNVLSEKNDQETIRAYSDNPRKPFINRAVAGLYTPGSIVKPFVALGALEEGIIDPRATIVSTGALSVPNPYNPDMPSIFKDWKAHGVVDMRRALAVSSNVYFYEVGGGFGRQRGLGITNIERYMSLFGFSKPTGIDLPSERAGIIPTPAWKEEQFEDGAWRLGDTYNTAIGQYGFQVTPLQMARAVAALANGGTLLTPRVERVLHPEDVQSQTLPFKDAHLSIVREGMLEAVRYGTAAGLAMPGITLGAKTGTAQVGVQNEEKHSWVVGFFPYENPRYSFAVVVEHGPAGLTPGSVMVMRTVLEWMSIHMPEYLQ